MNTGRLILFAIALMLMLVCASITILNLAQVMDSPYLHMTPGECILAILTISTILYTETKPVKHESLYAVRSSKKKPSHK